MTPCLFEDRLPQDELEANPEPLIEVVDSKKLPTWAKRWRKDLAPNVTLLGAYVPGNGAAFFFMVVVDGAGVRGLWKHATFAPN